MTYYCIWIINYKCIHLMVAPPSPDGPQASPLRLPQDRWVHRIHTMQHSRKRTLITIAHELISRVRSEDDRAICTALPKLIAEIRASMTNSTLHRAIRRNRDDSPKIYNRNSVPHTRAIHLERKNFTRQTNKQSIYIFVTCIRWFTKITIEL